MTIISDQVKVIHDAMWYDMGKTLESIPSHQNLGYFLYPEQLLTGWDPCSLVRTTATHTRDEICTVYKIKCRYWVNSENLSFFARQIKIFSPPYKQLIAYSRILALEKRWMLHYGKVTLRERSTKEKLPVTLVLKCKGISCDLVGF